MNRNARPTPSVNNLDVTCLKCGERFNLRREINNPHHCMKIEDIIAELEGIEREFLGYALVEKLSGNIVKEASNRGAATGIRITIGIIREHTPKESAK